MGEQKPPGGRQQEVFAFPQNMYHNLECFHNHKLEGFLLKILRMTLTGY